MQPPETEPTTAPSSASAMIEPIGRGEEPQVRSTVASRFSIASSLLASEGVQRVEAQQPGAARRRLEEALVAFVDDHGTHIVPVGQIVHPQEFLESPAVPVPVSYT